MKNKIVKITKKINIYCPLCKRRVLTWDGHSQNNSVVNCKKCGKRIVFHPDTKEIEVKEPLPRDQASGMRFY